MLILGFLGSPRKNGKCAQLMQKTLDGAASRGAKTKSYNLIDCNIEFCRGCGSCYLNQPELPIGKCPLKDDMHSILEEYIRADGYVFASPVYDVFITALMKQFLERKIMLTYRDRDAYATIPGPRVPANFKKKASLIVSANCSDEYQEVMGDPSFEAWQAHLPIEQVDTVDQFYVGGVEKMEAETFSLKLTQAFSNGERLYDEIIKAGMNEGWAQEKQVANCTS